MIAPRHQRRLQWNALAMAVCLIGNPLAQAERSDGPFVNVNGKYVLYSYPSAPYARHGVLYAPLVSFSELLGVRVTQAPNHRFIALLLNGKTTTFRRSGSMLLSGSKGQIRVPTEQLRSGELAVALPPLLDALKITYHIDASGLRVDDHRFLNPNIPPGQHFNYANGVPNRYKDWDYYFVDQSFPESLNFVPTRFLLTQTSNVKTVQAQFKFRQPRTSGSGVSMLVFNSNGTIVVKGDGLKPPPEPPPLPSSDFCQYSTGTVACKASINFAKGGHVQYVLVHAFDQP